MAADMILNVVPYGSRYAISREELARRLGTTDREARRMIQEAREEGYLIVNSGFGYYRSDEIDDIERQYRRDRSQALSILKRLKTMRRTLKEAGRPV